MPVVKTLLLLSIGGFGALVWLGSDAKGVENLEGVTLRANDRALTITNSTGADLEECKVTLNARYHSNWMKLPRGLTEVWYGELLSGDTLRFDPRQEPVRRVYVYCSKPTTADASFAANR